MPTLLDGNNLAHAVGMDRQELRRRLLDLVRRQKMRLIVIFDGPPPEGSPPAESLGRLSVEYSGAVSADDRIVARLGGGSGWTVVTGDRELARRCRHRGARIEKPGAWSRRLDQAATGDADEGLSADQVAAWAAWFGVGGE